MPRHLLLLYILWWLIELSVVGRQCLLSNILCLDELKLASFIELCFYRHYWVLLIAGIGSVNLARWLSDVSS